MKHHKSISPLLTNFDVRVDENGNRGIYLRELYETKKAREYSILIEPIFKPNSGIFCFLPFFFKIAVYL